MGSHIFINISYTYILYLQSRKSEKQLRVPDVINQRTYIHMYYRISPVVTLEYSMRATLNRIKIKYVDHYLLIALLFFYYPEC